MTAGLGLSQFLNHQPERSSSGGRGDWLENWKQAKVPRGQLPSIVVWLHPLAPIHLTYNHPFIRLVEADDKDKPGVKKRFLAFPRYISPDRELIIAEQHFRDKSTDAMQTPPDRDPFLILREWLRVKGIREELPLDTEVFKWVDPNPKQGRDKEIIWHLGHLSRLEERGKDTFGHSLDAKTEWIFTVFDNANIAAGPKLARETKALGDKLSLVIKNEQKSKGVDDGNPMVTPYAFLWEYDQNQHFDKAYNVLRYDQAECVDELWELMQKKEFPNGSPHATFAEKSLVEIRADMEAAMQIALPLDLIFSTEKEDRMAAVRGEGGEGTVPRRTNSGPVRPPSTPGAARQGANPTQRRIGGQGGDSTSQQAEGNAQSTSTPRRVVGATQQESGGQQSGGTNSSGRTRTRLQAAPPAEPPKPKVPTMACSGKDGACQYDLPVTDTTCPKCGAKYDPLSQEELDALLGNAQPQQAKGMPKEAKEGTIGASSRNSCFACGKGPIVKEGGEDKCSSCGIFQNELSDVPFD